MASISKSAVNRPPIAKDLRKNGRLNAPLRVYLSEHLGIFTVVPFAVCAELACAIMPGPVKLNVTD